VTAFGDELLGVLPELRQMAESLMTATCRITRLPDERGTMDPDTLQYAEQDAELIYEGKCRVQDRRDGDASEDAGERRQHLSGRELQLPVAGTEDVSVRDIVTILTNPEDEALVDREFTVDGRHEKSHATARRLPIVAVSG
jgi:hypothetical protein